MSPLLPFFILLDWKTNIITSDDRRQLTRWSQNTDISLAPFLYFTGLKNKHNNNRRQLTCWSQNTYVSLAPFLYFTGLKDKHNNKMMSPLPSFILLDWKTNIITSDDRRQLTCWSQNTYVSLAPFLYFTGLKDKHNNKMMSPLPSFILLDWKTNIITSDDRRQITRWSQNTDISLAPFLYFTGLKDKHNNQWWQKTINTLVSKHWYLPCSLSLFYWTERQT